MSEQEVPKKRRGRRPKAVEPAGPITVKIVLKSGQTLSFSCSQQFEDGAFLNFIAPGTKGMLLRRRVAIESIAYLEVEEYPSFQVIQQPQYQQPAVQRAPVMQSQHRQEEAPHLSLSPGMQALKQGLRVGLQNGTPVSELPDGSVVNAGFMPLTAGI